jgi:serine/threonine-protein kinase
MAVVYRGLDEGLEREVAVKLLHPHLAARVEHRRRMIREAKAVARLRHPNILEIFDFSGEEMPEAFLVTEFIRGTTLNVFAVDHPFDPPEVAAACVHVLAGALAHAHEQGIIHRDLKPENVMIQRAGARPVLKLMDFGIAQILDRDEKMTVTGALMGSPAHMAPEIIDGEEADERSDIFSLGTILYWLITGQLPFEGPSPGALLKQVLSGEFTDPRVLKPAVSDRLAAVVAHSLARNRADRIQTAAAFQSELAAALTDSGIADPAELITHFMEAPAETSQATRGTVVARLMEQGQAARDARKTGRALAAYSRVIAIVPGTPEAGAARQAIERLNSRRRWRRRAAMAAGLLVIFGAAAAAKPALSRLLQPPPEPPKVALKEPEQIVPEIKPLEPSKPITAPPLEAMVAPRTPPRTLTMKVDPRAASRPVVAPPTTVSAKAIPAQPELVALAVRSKPWGELIIDGETKASRTPYDGLIPAGHHLVEIRNPNGCCEPFRTEADLAAGVPREIHARLEPLPARVYLDVEGPADTAVLFDDQVKRVGDITLGKPLLVGIPPVNGQAQYDRSVVLRLRHDGFHEQEVPLHVNAGQEERIKVKMVPEG